MRLVLYTIVAAFAVAFLHVTTGAIPKLPPGKPLQHHRVAQINAAYSANTHPTKDSFAKEYDTTNRKPERSSKDIVAFYTRNAKLRAIVAGIAALALVVLTYSISMFLFSTSPTWLLWSVALFAVVSTFIKGDAGDFCRSVGVCVLLLSQRTSWARFTVRFVSQLKGLLRLSSRRPFPPCSNPWQYFPAEGEPDLQFGMMGALSSAVLSAAYLGWLVGRIVPLLPNWLGALSAACTVGYLTTLQDGRGDMLRFLGFSLCRCVSVLSATVDDVALRDRAGALLGHVLFFSQSVDSKYKVVARLQLLLTEFVSRLTMLIARLRSDMSGAPAARAGSGSRADTDEHYTYPEGPADSFSAPQYAAYRKNAPNRRYRKGEAVYGDISYEDDGRTSDYGTNFEPGPGQRQYSSKPDTGKKSWWS